jgi:hypothetical protein
MDAVRARCAVCIYVCVCLRALCAGVSRCAIYFIYLKAVASGERVLCAALFMYFCETILFAAGASSRHHLDFAA